MPQAWLSGFADEIDADPTAQIDTLSRTGVRHLELRGINGKGVLDLDNNEIGQLHDALGQAGIGVSSIGSPIGKVQIRSDLEAHFERFCTALERADQFDASFVRIFSFYHRDETAESCRDLVIEQLTRMAAAAEAADRVLLHENEKDIYGDTPQRCADLIESVASPYLRAAFDPANFIQCGVDTRQAWEKLRKHTVYFHVKDALAASGRVVPAGVGDADWPWLLEQAAAADFEGFFSLEPHLKADDPDYGGSGAERFTHTVEALRPLLEKAGIPIA
jgi:3-dehydroshikimate dehydratase